MTTVGIFASALILGGAVAGATTAARPTECALWRGKVGGRDVAVALDHLSGPNAMSGRYAYLHIGKPISLAGTRTDAGLSLEERAGSGKPSGRWTLSPAAPGSDALTGRWSTPDGKRTAPIDLVCLADSGGTLRDPWYAATPIGATTDQQFEAFVRYPEVATKVEERLEGTSIRQAALLSAQDRYQVVDRHPFRKAALEVNAAVRTRVGRARKDERQYLAQGQRCEIFVDMAIPFLSPRFAVVSLQGNHDAGGAHPDFDKEIWVFEMTDAGAKRLRMERLYDLKTANGRWKPAFRKLVYAAKKKEAAVEADPTLEDCPDGLEQQDDATVQLGIAEGGIDIDVSYMAHAIAACGYSVFVRAEQLAPFLRPGAPDVFRTGTF